MKNSVACRIFNVCNHCLYLAAKNFHQLKGDHSTSSQVLPSPPFTVPILVYKRTKISFSYEKIKTDIQATACTKMFTAVQLTTVKNGNYLYVTPKETSCAPSAFCPHNPFHSPVELRVSIQANT